MDATQNIPHKFIVTKALPSERKAYPIRWLVVVITMFATFFLLFFLLLLVERVAYDKKNVTNQIDETQN